jgi:hypothetical protein
MIRICGWCREPQQPLYTDDHIPGDLTETTGLCDRCHGILSLQLRAGYDMTLEETTAACMQAREESQHAS